MSEEPEFVLPELQDAVLDEPTLRQLVADLTTVATVQDVLLKGGPTARTDGAPVALSQAIELLLAGQVFGVQVRYRYDGAEWRDTLMQTASGVRLVRMRMPELG